MFQPPERPAFLQPGSGGYGIAHSLPEFTFEETPLGLSGGGGGGYGAGSGAAGAGDAGPGSLLYTSPIFSTTGSSVGPASGAFHLPFHHSTSPSANTNTPSPASSSLAHHHLHQRSSPLSSSSSADMESAHDVNAQEAAARDYQPNLQGPLVGNRIPSTVITEAYAKADPVYVAKTMVRYLAGAPRLLLLPLTQAQMLPQTYSHYRPIQGDGNCGWRAIAFGYFETLLSLGNKAELDAERQRIESLNAFIQTAGGHPDYVYQPMADETIELFDRLSAVFSSPEAAMTELLDSFNNAEIAGAIIYHFRLLAGAWLRGNADSFSAFITSDLGVSGYAEATIERPNVEIDNLGIILLVNVLLKPVGFVLEIAYLDRSAGSEVNHYRFPEEANRSHPSELGPTIHLLFRPDHYDILYLAGPPPPPPTTVPEVDLQVHRVAFSQGYEIASTPLHSYADELHANPLALIPGFDAGPPGLNTVMGLGTPSPISPFTASPASPWMSTPFAEPMPQHSQPPRAPITVPTPISAQPPQRHQLRFSEYCQLPEYRDTWREPAFQTSTFKNSHFNVAHYNNPNFQPEEYKPDADESELAPRVGSRKRGSV
ncbi:putative ubiquitin thioesterase [Echria macrotheca]|uniref:ubiquitinyl hydrolase 1 n=1 Tax=Echria macrotheca TaxID=438768 RepID=A0AAJ0BKT4_9PEZI|nr:putative ubiquitin thioesterase [Echria macrotheca]